MAKERVSLYFNTDIPLEKAMWEFISKDGRKSQKIKRAIEDAMKSSNFIPIKSNENFEEKFEEVDDEIDDDEIDEILL